MTHDELMDFIDKFDCAGMVNEPVVKALRAVVELHQPIWTFVAGTDKSVPLCLQCREGGSEADYPCQTIQTIEKELQ